MKLRVARRGFTLNEAIVSTAAASMLMLGLGSTVFLAARATDIDERPAAAVVQSSLTIDDLVAELHYATAFTERTPTAVQFTLADRTGDNVAETVRYAWSGTAGDPLVRTFNGAARNVREDVRHFELGYTVQTVEEIPDDDNTEPVAPTEVLAASFTGWSGVTPSTTFRSLSANVWASEYFELAWPPGATSFSVTRLRIKVGQTSTSGQFSVGFYSAAGGTGPLPSTTLLGSAQSVSCASLPSTPDWKEFQFSDVTMNDTTSGYNIVVKTLVAGGKLGYLTAPTAPQDATVFKHSGNAGVSWSPSASLEKTNDAPFEVYGVFTGGQSDPEVEPIERHFVRSVSVELRSGNSDDALVKTGVDVLNAPEVATP